MHESDTISEIQDFIRNQKLEEDRIEDKTKDRVTRQIAEGVKKNNPLPQGKCNLCSTESETLVPCAMKICVSCANKFIKRGGELKVISKYPQDYHCDMCLTRTFTVLYVNPKICVKCSGRIGSVHKFGTNDMQKDIQRENIEKTKSGVYL